MKILILGALGAIFAAAMVWLLIAHTWEAVAMLVVFEMIYNAQKKKNFKK